MIEMRIEFHLKTDDGEKIVVKDIQPSEASRTLDALMREFSAKEGFFRKERR